MHAALFLYPFSKEILDPPDAQDLPYNFSLATGGVLAGAG